MRVLYHKPVEHEKATKRPTLLHKKITLLWQKFLFEVRQIFLLYEIKKFAKGFCHRKQ